MIAVHYRRVLVCLSLLFSSRVASQQPVKVDDANVYSLTNPNGIQYSSNAWNTVSQETTEVHYNGTYTWSQQAGANLIFFFRGTAIALYAEKAARSISAAVLIDGNTGIGVNLAEPGDSQYQQQFWNVAGLAEGDHQIVISYYGTGNSSDDVLGLDYFEVTPGADGLITPISSGPGASVIPSNAVLVDDSSDMISYSGSSWETSGYTEPFAFLLGFLGGTEHSSATPGSAFTFRFNGTAVWYFSDQHENNTIAGISIDGGPPELVDTSSPTGEWLMQILVWGKTDLADGPHTVTITHMGAGDKYVNVDFFKYLPSSPSSASATHSKSTPIGAIVGGVIGGVALIALIVVAMIWRWRRRPSQDAAGSEHGTYVGDGVDDVKESYEQSVPGKS